MELLTDFLQEHSTILFPTTSEWLVISTLGEGALDRRPPRFHENHVAQMRHVIDLAGDDARLSLICAKAPQLRTYAAGIHPRIDTLLSIHQKELALLHSPTSAMDQLRADLQLDESTPIYVRLTRDEELLACIAKVGPLLVLDLGVEIEEKWSTAVENFPIDRVPGTRARTVYAEYDEKAELHFHPTESE